MLWLQWQNVAGLAWRQRLAHAVNAVILLAAVAAIAFALVAQTKVAGVTGFTAPAWLSGNSMMVGALWLFYVSLMLRFRLRSFRAKQAQDWLAALPISAHARWQFVKLKALGFFALELSVGAVFMAWLNTWRAAFAFVVLGAIFALLTIYLTANRQFNSIAAASALYTSCAKLANLSRPPLPAWFSAAMPSTVQLRWFWLLPMLLLPMATSLLYLCAVMLGFAAYLRMAAVSTAIGRAFLGMSALLHASPMPAAVLYRAGLRFALQALWPLLIIAGLLAWVLPTQLKLFGAGMVLLAGFLMIISQHHFSFGFRFLHAPQPGSHSERAAQARAWLVFLMVCGVLLRDLAPLLPIFCLMAWRWLHQRGLAPVTGPKSSARNPR